MKALIVDDDPDVLDLLEVALGDRGHTVSRTESAEAGLAAFESDAHPLIVLDWLMPGMDGLELCRRIRALPRGDRTTILVVTAKADPRALEQVLEAGADDYLAKPFDEKLLRVRIAIAESTAEQRVAKKRAEDELRRSHDDLLSIMNGLRVGTAIVEGDGTLSFLSETAERYLDLPAEEAIGASWLAALDLDAEALREMSARPEKKRRKVLASVKRPSGVERALEIEVRDDPRSVDRRILWIYDVSDVVELRKQLDQLARFCDLVGKSKPMREVYQLIRDVAPVSSTALILGETGTGKELVARAIHSSSPRAAEKLVPVNCAGLTESILTSQLFGHKKGAFTGADEDRAGLFEAANKGTIFLDELGDIPMSVQTALLRVLQEREIVRVGETSPRKIDVRVIAATHRDLAALVAEGKFRQDLLYRLRVVTIDLPPLRARREDIPLLTDSLLAEIGASIGKTVQGVSHEALRILVDFDWPGNVRELKSALESAIIRCRGTLIQPEDLPREILESEPAVEPLSSAMGEDDERRAIAAALEETRGNRTSAAKLLGISRATFYRRINELGIEFS